MKPLYFILLVILFANEVSAQNNTFTIEGNVYSELGKPVHGATITLFDLKTNKLLISAASDSLGSFKMTASNKDVYLTVTYVGYIPYRVVNFTNDRLKINLSQQAQLLNEVTVKSQRPFLEQQADRMVVNVQGDPKVGNSAIDILKKVPGIRIINDNDISLENKSVAVSIDGKMTRLSGNDLISLLNSTNARSIDQIEVLFNPSSKYDAQGEGGILNIKTLKRAKPGYDVFVSGSAGHGWKYFTGNSLSLGINYRNDNNYFYGTYNYGLGKRYQEMQTNTFLNQVNQRLLDSTISKSPYHNQNIRLGMDHYINKNDVIGFLITANDNRLEYFNNTRTGIYLLTKPTSDSTRISNSVSPRKSTGINLNLNYKAVLDTIKQKTITMDADGGYFDYTNDNSLNLILDDNSGNPMTPVQNLLQDGHTISKIFSYKLDYSQKIHKGTLEAGIKASHVNIENSFTSASNIDGQSFVDNGNDDFLYKETVLSAYITPKFIWGKFTLQPGIRAEQTFTDGNSVTLDSVVNRNYLSIFPNLITSYKFKSSLLSASYSRRIGRPPYNYLNPFSITSSAYFINKGNPYLLPSFTNNYRVGYSLLNKYTLTGSYSTSTDIISDLRTVDEQTKVTTNIKANLNSYKDLNLYLGYNNRLFDRLDLNYYVGIARSDYQFIYESAPIILKQTSGTFAFDTQLNFKNSLYIDVYFYGQTKVAYGNRINEGSSTTSVTIGKKVLKGKGSLSLDVNDIFFTGITRSYAQYGDVDYNYKSKYDSRNIKLNFSYSFGSTKINIRKRTPGSTEEQNRNNQSY